MAINKRKLNLIRKAVSLPLCFSMLSVFSAFAFADSNVVVGELMVSQMSFGGNVPEVSVNGELAKSGRSVFSSSSIITSENTTAIVYLGRLGSVELAPNSVVLLSFDSDGASGQLSSGKITVLGASNPMSFTNSNGESILLGAGESLDAAVATQDDDDADLKKKSVPGWVWAVIVGAVAAGVGLGASGGSGSSGGNPAPVSPIL